MIRFVRVIRVVVALGLISSSVFQGGPKAKAESQRWDFSIPAMYTLDSCKADTELDCVESVAILTPEDALYKGTFNYYSSENPTVDSNGNTIVSGTQHWDVNVDGKIQTLDVVPNMETASHACCTFQGGRLKRFGSLRTFVYGLTGDQRVQFVLRTSWIKPLDVPMYAAHANFKEEPIQGGRRWTFTGANMTSYGFRDDTAGTISQKLQSLTALANWSNTGLYFTIDHAGINDEMSAFSQECSDLGYTAQASNATTAGMPYWNPSNQSLDFAIAAPHLTTSGEVNKGFFQFWAKTDYMNCKWPGNTLAKSSSFTVSVTDETGSAETVETSAAGITNGVFHLTVEGLHFSSPSIRVKPVVQETPKPSASPGQSSEPSAKPSPSSNNQEHPAPKKTTITCVKGKSVKKVTAVSPKCPSGYKKKA